MGKYDIPPTADVSDPEEEAEIKRAAEKALYEEGLEIASFDEAQKAAEAVRKSQEKESPDEISDAARLLDAFDKGDIGNRNQDSINLEDYLPPIEDESGEVEQKYSVPGITERPATKEELLLKLEDILKKVQNIFTKVLMNENEYQALVKRYHENQNMEDTDREKIAGVLDDIQTANNQIASIKEKLSEFNDSDLNEMIERLTDNITYFGIHGFIPNYDSSKDVSEVDLELQKK